MHSINSIIQIGRNWPSFCLFQWPAPFSFADLLENNQPHTEYINSEDEDYSLSLSAVIQRRASVRGRKKGYYSPRRASSPMAHSGGVFIAGNSIAVSKADRRRSSVYTTSSGE